MTKKLKNIVPQFFQTMKETKNWLDKMEIKNYEVVNKSLWDTINPETLIVDVNGNVDLSHKNLTYFPVQFREVNGTFWCHANQLSSLKGSPISVGSNFFCDHNQLISLNHCPKYIGDDFYCDSNPLESLEELLNCDIKGYIEYTYNNNLSPIFECKEFRNKYVQDVIDIPFPKLKELLLIEQEKKLIQSKISPYMNRSKNIAKDTMYYSNPNNKIKL